MVKSRILILENSIAVTGALVSITRSCSDLKDHFDFFFVLPKGSRGGDYVRRAGFSVYHLPLLEIRRDFWTIFYVPFLLANAVRLRRLLRSLRIDLINVNDFYNLLPACYRFFGGKIPYVCYVRFLPSKFPSVLVRTWSFIQNKFARKLICVSNAVHKELPYKEKVVVIGNELPGSPVEYKFETETTILYPANYIPGKGQQYALESFAAIHAKYPTWKLRFVGGDMGLSKNKNFKDGLVKRSKALGLDNQIEWLDFSENMASQYSNASIVLNFSESESFSMTCLEALYYGRPVIATKCGGPEEIIEDGRTGILVELQDINGMAQAIESLITNASERQKMGARGYLDVRQKFSFENTGKKLLRLYNSLLSKQSFNTR